MQITKRLLFTFVIIQRSLGRAELSRDVFLTCILDHFGTPHAAMAISLSPQDTTQELLDCFERATAGLGLCPNRVWAVAREELPALFPESLRSEIADDPEKKREAHHQNHELCTWEFCEYSRRDFTNVQQRHECPDGKCSKFMLRYRFSRRTLERAALNCTSTAWELSGKALLKSPRPYMAVSHVWSDGTGAGAWGDSQVNQCLYNFFQDMAYELQCEGIWWDTICIPTEKTARTNAIKGMEKDYQNAQVTLVHDLFLRNWVWDPETACFAILMSPWFSRGWTALELANSAKVKVVFKRKHGGLVIKDLDEEILARDDEQGPRQVATQIIRLFRTTSQINNLNDLLAMLGSRFTSWPKDLAIISALLTGVEVSEQQQTIYERVLRKVGRILHAHLFHNSATMPRNFNWCPTSLYSMPLQPLQSSDRPYLSILGDGSLHGKWRVLLTSGDVEHNLLWESTVHPLIRRRLEYTLKQAGRHFLLAELGNEPVSRAILVTETDRQESSSHERKRFRYLGTLRFREHVPEAAWEIKTVILSGEGTYQNQTENMTRDKVQSDGQTPETLDQAVWKGDIDSARSLLRASRQLETIDESGRNLLHLAALRGKKPMVSLLLESASQSKGFPSLFTAKCQQAQTALHYAAWSGSYGVFTMIAERSNLLQTNKRGNTAMHIAARMGFISIVEHLLRVETGLLEVKGSDGLTPLHYAAMNGHEEVVALLVNTGANAEAKDLFGWMPLHYAAGSGNVEVVRLLKDNLMQPLYNTELKWTPLHIAAMFGNELVVRFLDIRSYMNVEDTLGWSPWRFAHMNGHFQMRDLLSGDDNRAPQRADIIWDAWHLMAVESPRRLFRMLADGEMSLWLESIRTTGDPLELAVQSGLGVAVRYILATNSKDNMKNKARRQMVFTAAQYGQDTILQALIDGGEDFQPIFGAEAFHEAARLGHGATMGILLDRKIAHVDCLNADGETALFAAAARGDVTILQCLLDFGADVYIRKAGESALGSAVRAGKETPIKMLIDAGADVNTVTGGSPLLVLAVKDVEGFSPARMRLLTENGADVNAKDIGGCSALWWAVERNRIAMAKELLTLGAETNTTDQGWGFTPLGVAVAAGRKEMAKLLIQMGADVNQNYYARVHLRAAALELGNKLLVQGAASLSKEHSARVTPLIAAVIIGDKDMSELLLEAEADVEKEDRSGHTPLINAVRSNRPAIVKFLLEKGAVVDKKDKDGQTALYHCIPSCAKYGLGLLEILVAAGADINASDNSGKTVLMVAREEKSAIAIECLIALGAFDDGEIVDKSVRALSKLTKMALGLRRSPNRP